MLPRPRFRLPIWAAFAIVAAAYVGRSAVRGFDFRLDLPIDAIVFVLFLLVAALVTMIRASEGVPDDADAAARLTDDNGTDAPHDTASDCDNR